MKILKTFTVLALAFCATLARADPPSQVGRLNYISGPVSFAPAEANNDWAAATLNRPVTTGDRLWTDDGGRAEMHIGSMAIRLSALTNVDMLNLDDRNLQLRLAQGSVNLRVRRLASDKTLEIDTPGGAVMVTRPGSYRIGVDPSGAETTVVVHRGQVEVLTSTSAFQLNDGQRALIPGARGTDYDIVTAPPADEFDRWAAARDQREDRIAATRYVSDEMTGYEDLDDYGAWREVRDYGPVWVPAAVPVGWAPYRYGHWVWVSPWGWTWVDSAPWGFAPFHYGRWVWLGSYWGWAPGVVVARPVYAPALVAFIGGSDWSVSVGIGAAPAVGWVPLGWREPYIPWYRVSPAYVRQVNITHVRNIDVTKIYNFANDRNTGNDHVTRIKYANRGVPSAVTVVSRDAFVSSRPVSDAALKISPKVISSARVISAAPVAAPVKKSIVGPHPGSRPPAATASRDVMAVTAPPKPSAADVRTGALRNGRGGAPFAADSERPPVRVIKPQRADAADAQPSRPQPQHGGGDQRPQKNASPQSQSKPQLPERRAATPPPEAPVREMRERQVRPERAPSRPPVNMEDRRPEPRTSRDGNVRSGPEPSVAPPAPRPDAGNYRDRGNPREQTMRSREAPPSARAEPPRERAQKRPREERGDRKPDRGQ